MPRKNRQFTEKERDIYKLGYLNGEDHGRREAKKEASISINYNIGTKSLDKPPKNPVV